MKMLILYIILFCHSWFSLSSKEKSNTAIKPFWTEENSPEVIGKKITEDLLKRSDFMMYRSEQCTAVHYAEACAGFGAVKLAGWLNDSLTIQRLSKRYSRVLDEKILNTANHVDANVYGILPLELFIQNKEAKFLTQGIDMANKQWEDPLPDGLTNQTRFWIDDIWMIGSLQVQAYRATGKEVYLDRAALEIDAYLNKLQQANGLFYHGENAPFFWGRGNGWVAAGLAEVLSELPQSNEYYSSILNGYKKMMEALLKFQAEDGMWRQLIVKEDSYKEASCTAMFGYAITVGVKKGILPKETYNPVYQKAWNSLVKYIDEEGRVSKVCVGTGQSTDINYYLNSPTSTGDFHGQAPLLWFALSLLNN